MIGQTVRKIRKSLDLGQIEFAKFVECNQSHLSKIERGEVEPSAKLLAKIIRFAKQKRVKVKLDDLF